VCAARSASSNAQVDEHVRKIDAGAPSTAQADRRRNASTLAPAIVEPVGVARLRWDSALPLAATAAVNCQRARNVAAAGAAPAASDARHLRIAAAGR
jgi:hypothetical protein